jgi:hypothetical protein
MKAEMPSPNVSVAANLWLDVQHPDADPGPYAALAFIPGDLRVNLLGTRDVRSLNLALTDKQRREYRYCRFFAPHGQQGTTYQQ